MPMEMQRMKRDSVAEAEEDTLASRAARSDGGAALGEEIGPRREIAGAFDSLRRADHRSISDIYRDGLVNILEDEGTRHAIRLLEERTLLASVLTEQEAQGGEGVQVVIGGDGR